MAQTRLIDYIGGVASTVGAATADILTTTPPSDINSLVILHVLATTATTDDRAVWLRCGFVHKSAGGVLVVDQNADIVPSFATAGIKHADIDTVISGGSIILRVIGDSGFAGTILWEAYAHIFRS